MFDSAGEFLSAESHEHNEERCYDAIDYAWSILEDILRSLRVGSLHKTNHDYVLVGYKVALQAKRRVPLGLRATLFFGSCKEGLDIDLWPQETRNLFNGRVTVYVPTRRFKWSKKFRQPKDRSSWVAAIADEARRLGGLIAGLHIKHGPVPGTAWVTFPGISSHVVELVRDRVNFQDDGWDVISAALSKQDRMTALIYIYDWLFKNTKETTNSPAVIWGLDA